MPTVASKRCTDVTIKKNKVWNNGQNGIMLHRSCDRALITKNEVWENGDAGVALYESSDCKVVKNILTENRQGIRWSNGANRNIVKKNDIKHSSLDGYAVYMYSGSDEPEADGNVDGSILDNKFHRNTVKSDNPDAVEIQDAHDNSFKFNNITKGEFATFEDSIGNIWNKNTVPVGFSFDVDSDSCFSNNDEGLLRC